MRGPYHKPGSAAGPKRFGKVRRGERKGEEVLDTARHLRLLVGTVLLALTLALGGCGGSDVKEEQQDVKEEQKDVQEEQKDVEAEQKDVEEAEKEAQEDQPVGQPGQGAEPQPGEPEPGGPGPEPGKDVEPAP